MLACYFIGKPEYFKVLAERHGVGTILTQQLQSPGTDAGITLGCFLMISVKSFLFFVFWVLANEVS